MEMTSSNYVSDMSAGDSYSKGWQLFRANMGLFIGVVFAQFLLTIPSNLGGGENPNGFLLAFGSAWNFFVVTPVGMSTAWVYLRAARGDDVSFRDMFAVFERNYVNALVASLLLGFIIVIGFMLLIVPGIYLAIRLSFVPYMIIDEQMGAIDALKASWAHTKGHALTIFVMALIAIPVALLGLLALGIGIVVSSAVIAASFGVFYHSVAVRGKMKEKPKNDDQYAF